MKAQKKIIDFLVYVKEGWLIVGKNDLFPPPWIKGGVKTIEYFMYVRKTICNPNNKKSTDR